KAMAGEQLVDSFKQRVCPRGTTRRKDFREGGVIRARRDETALENRLDLGGEEQTVAGKRPIQRLHAKTVARKQQPARNGVPQGEGTQPAELMDAVVTPFFVRVNDRLRVGPRSIHVTGPLQTRADVAMVVNLSVVGDPDVTAFVGQRLVTGGEIDDAQATV